MVRWQTFVADILKEADMEKKKDFLRPLAKEVQCDSSSCWLSVLLKREWPVG